MKPLFTVGLALALTAVTWAELGCVSLRAKPGVRDFYDTTPAVPESPECIQLDNDYVAWGTVAAVAGFLAGGGGITAALPSDQTPRLVLGLTSLGVGAMSVASTYLSNSYASRYTATCTTKSSAPSPTAQLDRSRVLPDESSLDDGVTGREGETPSEEER